MALGSLICIQARRVNIETYGYQTSTLTSTRVNTIKEFWPPHDSRKFEMESLQVSSPVGDDLYEGQYNQGFLVTG